MPGATRYLAIALSIVANLIVVAVAWLVLGGLDRNTIERFVDPELLRQLYDSGNEDAIMHVVGLVRNTIQYTVAAGIGVAALCAVLWLVYTLVKRPNDPGELSRSSIIWWSLGALSVLAAVAACFFVVQQTAYLSANAYIYLPAACGLAAGLISFWLAGTLGPTPRLYKSAVPAGHLLVRDA